MFSIIQVDESAKIILKSSQQDLHVLPALIVSSVDYIIILSSCYLEDIFHSVAGILNNFMAVFLISYLKNKTKQNKKQKH